MIEFHHKLPHDLFCHRQSSYSLEFRLDNQENLKSAKTLYVPKMHIKAKLLPKLPETYAIFKHKTFVMHNFKFVAAFAIY